MTQILKLGPDDEATLADALAACGLGTQASDMVLSDPRVHAFVALDSGAAVGIAYGFELLRPEGFWMLVLCRIETQEEARRRGVGHDLLDAFASFARGRGHRSMRLFTDAGHDAARRLYESAGGEAVGDPTGYWWVFE